MNENDIIREWASLSDADLQQRIGEMTVVDILRLGSELPDGEIRLVRAVLASMMRSIESRMVFSVLKPRSFIETE